MSADGFFCLPHSRHAAEVIGVFGPKGFFFFGRLFAISWATPAEYGGSQASGTIGAVTTSLCQSHSNAGSEPRLRPYTTALGNAGPLTTEQGQGPNPQPHGS